VTAVGKPKTAEMHLGPGFRIASEIVRPSVDAVAALGQFETPAISDLMNRLYTMDAGIKNLVDPSLRILGPACTVKLYPGDNLMVHKAIDLAQPGDVIVVDAGGFNDHAIIGELMSARAKQRGVAGMVIWGAIRDSAELGAGTYPVFASGVTHRGPYKNGPGEINVPVTMGGMQVNPGDIIVGDADGLVAVPQEMAERVLASARAILEKETKSMKEIVAGTVDRSWVDKALKEKGYRF